MNPDHFQTLARLELESLRHQSSGFNLDFEVTVKELEEHLDQAGARIEDIGGSWAEIESWRRQNNRWLPHPTPSRHLKLVVNNA